MTGQTLVDISHQIFLLLPPQITQPELTLTPDPVFKYSATSPDLTSAHPLPADLQQISHKDIIYSLTFPLSLNKKRVRSEGKYN